MTDKHLFRFGFETPDQYRNNAARGLDDEDSAALWIVSTTPAEALQWGETVAQAYVAWLFSSEQTEEYSWRDLGFPTGLRLTSPFWKQRKRIIHFR